METQMGFLTIRSFIIYKAQVVINLGRKNTQVAKFYACNNLIR